jgi:hypothetical protein
MSKPTQAIADSDGDLYRGAGCVGGAGEGRDQPGGRAGPAQLAETRVARHWLLVSAYEGWQSEAAVRELLLAQQLNLSIVSAIFSLSLSSESNCRLKKNN